MALCREEATMTSSLLLPEDWSRKICRLSNGWQLVLKRLTLAERLHFLAAHHDLIAKVKMIGLDGLGQALTPADKAAVELELAKTLLHALALALEPAPGSKAALADYILHELPAHLGMEILQHVSQEFSLTSDEKKN